MLCQYYHLSGITIIFVRARPTFDDETYLIEGSICLSKLQYLLQSMIYYMLARQALYILVQNCFCYEETISNIGIIIAYQQFLFLLYSK